MKSIVYTLALFFLPLWWTYTLLWNPNFIHVVANLSYRFQPPQYPLSVITEARSRAILYSTVDANFAVDIVFTPNELSHLDDVASIVIPTSRFVHFFGALAWIVLLVTLLSKTSVVPAFHRLWKVYAGISVIALAALVFFSFAFVLFHEVLFPAGNWQFPADSVLIQTFPETFWKLCLGFVLGSLALTTVLYWYLARLGSSRNNS